MSPTGAKKLFQRGEKDAGHQGWHKGDGGGGVPRTQGQGQANKAVDNRGQNRGHG